MFVAGHCGDALCDGGLSPDPPPDQLLFPGTITVPAGCACRSCAGCIHVCLDELMVVCTCRRCACRSIGTSGDQQPREVENSGTSKEKQRGCCSSTSASHARITKDHGNPRNENKGNGFGTEVEVEGEIETPRALVGNIYFDTAIPICCQ